MYRAVTASFNTVWFPSVMTVVESLVHWTVVAGPPVEIQARVNESSEWRVKVISSTITTLPAYIDKRVSNFADLLSFRNVLAG